MMPSHAWRPFHGLSSEQIKRMQCRRLGRFLEEYIVPFSPFYRVLLRKHRVNARQIRTLDDLRRLPFSSKKDFIMPADNEQSFRQFILQPDKDAIRRDCPWRAKIRMAGMKTLLGRQRFKERLGKEYRPIFITFTTGTTRKPVPFAYTAFDIGNLHLAGRRMIDLFGITQDSYIVNMFPFAPHLAFWQVALGGLAAHVLTLNTGGGKVMSTEGNIATVLKMKPAVILGVPSYIYHVLRAASLMGCRMPFVRKVILGAARVSPAYKKRLKDLLSTLGADEVQIMGTYGFTEARMAWGEYLTPQGQSAGYHLYPDKEIFEVIDPKTGEPKREGEDGELVYTSLDSRGSVVIRYRTGDYVKGGITYSPSPFGGLCVPRVSSDITRLSDIRSLRLSKIKGSLVNLNNFVHVLSEIDGIQEWQIEIRKKDNDPFEVDELVFYICCKENADKQKVETELNKQCLLFTEVSPNAVIHLPLNELVEKLELESGTKDKRIVDTRPTGG